MTRETGRLDQARPRSPLRWIPVRLRTAIGGRRLGRLTERIATIRAAAEGAARPVGRQDPGLAPLEGEVQRLERAMHAAVELAEHIERRAAQLTDDQGGTVGPQDGLIGRLRAVEALLERAGAAPRPPRSTVELHPGRPEPPPAPRPAPPPAGDAQVPSATAVALMQLVDRVGAATTVHGGQADSLLTWLYGRLVAVLEGEGVKLIDDRGRFDATRHEAIDTRPTDDAEQDGAISDTVRPGFELAGVPLRPQQVVVWTLRS